MKKEIRRSPIKKNKAVKKSAKRSSIKKNQVKAKSQKKVKSKSQSKTTVKKVKKAIKKSAPKKSSTKKFIAKKTGGKNIKQKFPGYPHYPAKEDIMNPENSFEKTELVEEIRATFSKPSKPVSSSGKRESSTDVTQRKLWDDEKTDDLSESDVTSEEINLIGSDELSADLGDDEQLRKRTWDVDMAGEDLDIPGSEIDDENENIGREDEENNSYSIGGDRHEDLEEDRELGR